MSKCKQCGNPMGILWTDDVCQSCQDLAHKEFLRNRAPEQNKAQEKEQKELAKIVLTTETVVDFKIVKRLEIITAECVFGMNVFRDLFAGVRDFVGGRSEATQHILRDSRKTALTELRKEARALGANAVVGVDLDYSEFSGGGKSMLFIVASGTAVIAELENN